MALAFKRSTAEADAAIVSSNNSIKEWYNPPSNPALIADWESAKAVQGVSKQNPNSEEGPKNITIVNWMRDNASYFHSVWGDIKYKGDFALTVALKHIDKVVVHFDDKSPSGKYNTYTTEIKGKDVHVVVHFDFDNYPQQLTLDTIDETVWSHLETVANISFHQKKNHILTYESSNLKGCKDKIKEVIGRELPVDVDWDPIEKITGRTEQYSNKPPVPNNYLALYFLDEQTASGFYGAQWSVDALCKDDLGKSAFNDTFDKVVLHVASGSGGHTVTKNGKELHFNFVVNFADFNNQSTDYSDLAKKIEASL